MAPPTRKFTGMWGLEPHAATSPFQSRCVQSTPEIEKVWEEIVHESDAMHTVKARVRKRDAYFSKGMTHIRTCL